MYIKSITIDGFKSYGQRTIVEGFDPYFNAITGLNGSGKSNILDGICFLLGISNLSQVRAANLQELVYKNGQTGITKATVSITFDNNDPAQSPIGYGHHSEISVTRQIAIGGQNKYLINGTGATNTRVKDLFQSVQLNVNNPHFLIMQGRVTKVLNMKPPEILSMLEEASGTKMYESKKLTAQKTIETKEAKIREIKTLLKEDITPTLNRLREERAAFLEFQKVERELEHLTKLDIAHNYYSAEKISKKSDKDLACEKEAISALEIKNAALMTETQEVHEKIEQQLKKRELKYTECKTGLENLKTCEKTEVKLNSNLRNTEKCLKDEEDKLNSFQKTKNDDSSAISHKQGLIEECENELQELKENNTKDLAAVRESENRLQAIHAGLSYDDEGEKQSLVHQLMETNTKITSMETKLKQCEMKSKHMNEVYKKKSIELKSTGKDYAKNSERLKPLETEIENIKKQMDKCGYKEDQIIELNNRSRQIQNEIYDMQEKKDSFVSRNQQLDFVYDDPIPRFDRNKVKGVLCEAFTVKDKAMATALEVVAGGRLYNVIVDSEVTGKLILEKGNLRRRHTIIPLNKINSQSISPDVLRRAQSLVGKENVWSALSLIDYDKSLQAAMEFAFGSSLICRDQETARKVAFDPNIRKRTVTLDGDVFDPSGTLTGGSRRPGEPFLLLFAEVAQLKTELKTKKIEFDKISKTLKESTEVAKVFNELKRNLDLKEQDVSYIRQAMTQTVHYKLLEEVEELKLSIENEEKCKIEFKTILEDSEVKVKELENQMKNASKIREEQLKAAESNLATCREQAQSSSDRVNEKLQVMHTLKAEIEELKNGMSNVENQVQTVEKNIMDFKKELASIFAKVSDAKFAVQDARQKVEVQDTNLKLLDSEIQDLHKQETELKNVMEKNKLEIKTIQMKITKIKSTAEDVENRLKDLLARYEWINEEKKYFGKPNTQYDFNVIDPNEAHSQIVKLKERKEELSRNVNMRAMSLLDKTEEQYAELMKKKEIVEKDKQIIATVIKELDEKKKEALQVAWKKVNEDFGSIFSTLLPGTQAKLVPLEGKSVLDGLEVKVAFGDTWKQSLNELSGGQRSLVALSLILSLLLFKPAPIYILDEVDAALDLSHTQNIGNMLKSHFKHSQFIIVSLKDGMFNNANVLFKTKFVDGMSTVSRHVQKSHTY